MICPACGHRWKAGGPKLSVPDDLFRRTCEEAAGNISETARRLGMKTQAALTRAKVLGIPATGHSFRYAHITDVMVLDAWRNNPTLNDAARELGMTHGVLSARLRDLPEYREHRKRDAHRTQHARAKIIAEAVAKAGGNFSAAALELGLSRERVRQLWNRDVMNQPEQES